MIKNVNSYFSQHKYKISLWLLVTAVVGFLAPLKAFNLQWIIDSSSKKQAMMYVGLGALVIIGSFVFELMSRRIYTNLVCGAEAEIRNDVMKNILNRDMSAYEGGEDSAYISLLTNDMRTLYDDYFTSVFNLIFWGAILLAALGMYLFISPILLLVVVVISVPPLLIPRILNAKIRTARDTYSLETAEYIRCIKEQLSGFETIWNFLRQGCFIGFHKEKAKRNQKEEEKFQQSMNTAVTVTSFMSNLTFIIILIVGMFLVFDGHITMGYMVTACSLANFVISPCQIMSQSYVKIRSTKGIRERLEKEMNLLPKTQENKRAVEHIHTISCENMSFSYAQKEKQTLRAVDFIAENQEKIGIIGESGSGKSTFAKILHQYYPEYEGKVWVNGIELKNLEQKCFFSKVGYISQSTFLFQDTIRNNICMYEAFSDFEVKRALEMAGLGTFIEELPDGMDTMLEENGKNLSGGQRQRMAIARLIIRKYQVIIADEITSGLDKETAEQVMNNLLSLNCMILAITHDTNSNFMEKFERLYRVEGGTLKIVRDIRKAEG